MLIPEHLYTDDLAWDNVDINAAPGVSKVVDLFNYPWDGLEDNAYDYAILSHVAEHIPHHIVWRGEFIHRHPDYQNGWFAFFGQLWRIMKPGGKVYALSPYAFSLGAVSDPTHTRYLTPASFNYFNAPDNDSPFEYRMAQHWDVNLERYQFRPHEAALQELNAQRGMVAAVAHMMTLSKPDVEPLEAIDWGEVIHRMAVTRINMIADFCMEMTAIKDEDQREKPVTERSAVGELAQGVDGSASAGIRAESIVGSGATD